MPPSKKKRGRKPLNLTAEERSARESKRKIKKRVRAREWNEKQKVTVRMKKTMLLYVSPVILSRTTHLSREAPV